MTEEEKKDGLNETTPVEASAEEAVAEEKVDSVEEATTETEEDITAEATAELETDDEVDAVENDRKPAKKSRGRKKKIETKIIE